MGYAELLLRRLDKEKDGATWSAAEVILGEAERMAEIVRKIGKITKYETKSYVGRARILDLDKAAGIAPAGGGPSSPPPTNGETAGPASANDGPGCAPARGSNPRLLPR